VFRAVKAQDKIHNQDPAINRRRRGIDELFNSVSDHGDQRRHRRAERYSKNSDRVFQADGFFGRRD
jgi:hypothetical protein